MNIRKPFEANKRLTSMEVYFSAVGIFEANKFTLVKSYIEDSYGIKKEKARIYRKTPGGRLYILYYPGKDNTFPDKVFPLTEIKKEVDDFLRPKFSEDELKNAKKIFIVAENNSYLGFPIAHFIKADLTNGVLTTEDSIDRNYDESEITTLFPEAKHVAIKRGWQNMIFDNWTCGHHTIAAIKRDILGEQIPREFDIHNMDEAEKNKILDGHSNYYETGLEAPKKPPNPEKESITDFPMLETLVNDADDLSYSSEESLPYYPPTIPVSGKVGFYANNCDLSITTVEKAFQAYDKNLEVILNKTDEQCILNIYTNKKIPALEKIGLKKIQDKNNFSYYELNVIKQAPASTHPLFGIYVSVNNTTRCIGVSDLFTSEEIIKFKNEATRNRNEQQIIPQNAKLLRSMQTMNKYLTTRAKETPGFWGSLTGIYSGRDYYKRRNSWKKILGKFNEHCIDNEKVTKENLIKLIEQELAEFKPGFFSFLQLSSHRYHACLNNLLNQLNQANGDLTEIQQRVSSYYQVYDQMDTYRRLTQSYVYKFSVFSPKENAASAIREKQRALYEAQYDLLTAEDKKDFLTTKQEHTAEYKNTAYHAKW